MGKKEGKSDEGKPDEGKPDEGKPDESGQAPRSGEKVEAELIPIRGIVDKVEGTVNESGQSTAVQPAGAEADAGESFPWGLAVGAAIVLALAVGIVAWLYHGRHVGSGGSAEDKP
jgi:hypothetical protein